MTEWERLLDIQWPKDACDRSGECCRGAAQVAPWSGALRQASLGDTTARAFLNQFVPYSSLEEARQHAPDAVAASLDIARSRGDRAEDLVFYRCRFLKDRSDCQIYEDRPALCREFPESPFGAVPSCCGYSAITRMCRDKLEGLRQELADLKSLQSRLKAKENSE
ncbi:MAG TPA: YkgJ family cysteine cluster protein [Coleofasciculaceae cyanobacterium]|jgi:Fe-S-cluster containining protein